MPSAKLHQKQRLDKRRGNNRHLLKGTEFAFDRYIFIEYKIQAQCRLVGYYRPVPVNWIGCYSNVILNIYPCRLSWTIHMTSGVHVFRPRSKDSGLKSRAEYIEIRQKGNTSSYYWRDLVVFNTIWFDLIQSCIGRSTSVWYNLSYVNAMLSIFKAVMGFNWTNLHNESSIIEVHSQSKMIRTLTASTSNWWAAVQSTIRTQLREINEPPHITFMSSRKPASQVFV